MAAQSGTAVHGDDVLHDARRVSRHVINSETYEPTADDEERFYLVEIHAGEHYAGDTTLPEPDDPNHATWHDQYVAVFASADGGRAVRVHLDADDGLPHAIGVPVGEGTAVDEATSRRYGGIVASAHQVDGEWRVRELLTKLAKVVR